MLERVPHRARLPVGLLVMLFTTGCATTSANPTPSQVRNSPGVVVQGEELWAFGGRLLDGLRGRVTTMQVHRPVGDCPQVVLRGRRTIVGSTRPEVYVDGTRMTDTCILDTIRVGDIKRVEVYPGGISGRSRYVPSPNGLIVVFMLDGT
jgi:hypothetical protein